MARCSTGAAALLAALTFPAIAVAAPPPITADLAEPPLVGDKDGLVFLRDRRDLVRLYPHAQLDLDAHESFGSRVRRIGEEGSGADLGPRFYVRRARLDLSGELFERLAFDVGLNLAAQPSVDGARADGRSSRVALADAWGAAEAGRGLHLMLGVFQSPLSLENRTAESDLAMMERNIAIRSFVVPGGKVLGALVGGRTRRSVLSWDAGVLGAESLSPGEFQRGFDGIARLTWQPFAANPAGPFHGVQIEVGGRVGTRDARDGFDEAPALTSGHGYAFWRPTRDEAGRVVEIGSSGTDWTGGASFRLPFHGVVFRSEGFWVSRQTRETITARSGSLRGVGAYAEVSWWVLQSFGLISGEPPAFGTFPHAEHLEVAATAGKPDRYGLEAAVLGAAVRARYESASRPTDDIAIYQLSGALNYWHTRRFRVSADASFYSTPTIGNNAARVPGRLDDADPHATALWEVGARTTLMF